MSTAGTIPNNGVDKTQANANSPSNGQVTILVGNGTKPEQILNAVKNNEAGISVIIPGNLSSSAVQNLIALFKDNANSFRITHLEVADNKLTLTLEAADKTKQATMTNAAFQLTGAAVSGVWVAGAMRNQPAATPNKLGGTQPSTPGKLADVDPNVPFSQALDNIPPAPRGTANTRTRDMDDFDPMATGKGVNLQAHIQMAQAAQGALGGIGGMAAAPAQHDADTKNAEAQYLDHTLSFLQDLISQNNNNANNLS